MDVMKNINDLRVQKTVAVIHQTFEELMLEKTYSKITVTELCNRARINKKTFYRYYPTLDDLLEEIEKQYGLEYIELTRGMHYPEDLADITRLFLEFSARQGPLYDAIVCSGRHEEIFTKVMYEMEVERYVVSKPYTGWTEDEWSLYMAAVTTVQWRIYQQWVENGRKVPLDRMIDIALQILCESACLR